MGHPVRGVLRGVSWASCHGRGGTAGLWIGGWGVEHAGQIVVIGGGEVEGEIHVGDGGGERVGIEGGGGGSVVWLEVGIVLRGAGGICVVPIVVNVAIGRK